MRLKEEPVDELVNSLYGRMFTRYYNGNDKIFGGNFRVERNMTNKEFIREKLIAGFDVRTGYTTSAVRGARNYLIFYKE